MNLGNAAFILSIPFVVTASLRAEPDERNGYITEYHFSNFLSNDARNSPNNFVTHVNLQSTVGGPNNVIGIGWDVTLQTLAPGSWLSDMTMFYNHTGGGLGNGRFLTPGITNDFSGGPTQFSSNGIVKFQSGGIVTGSNGLIRLEFFEGFDDAVNETDGVWLSGTIYFMTGLSVPQPATAGVFLATAVAVSMRRRRQDP